MVYASLLTSHEFGIKLSYVVPKMPFALTPPMNYLMNFNT
jgi:hypothetical protein